MHAPETRLKVAPDPTAPFVSSGSSEAENFRWSKPIPLPSGLPTVEQFDYELLTSPLRRRVADISERMQSPPDFAAVAHIVMISSVIGRKVGIAPKEQDDWIVVPNLWGAVVGRPGVMKSPSLIESMRPLRRLESLAIDAFEEAQKEHSAAVLVREQAKLVTKQRVKELLRKNKSGQATDAARDLVGEEEGTPSCQRYIVNDSTVEKLGEILKENPQGVLLYRDELNGYFRNLEKHGREGDRAFYLECWNGDGEFTYDRIGRGTVRIESACLSILGGIQPGPLSNLVRSVAGAGDDGLLQRFQLLVWPDPSKDWRNVDRPPNLAAKDEVSDIVDRLDCMRSTEVMIYRFAPEAQELFNAWREALEVRLRDGKLHPALEAHLSKYRSLVPSLALVLYLTENDGDRIDRLSAERAIAWAAYLESHAKRVYAPAMSPDVNSAVALAARMTAGDVRSPFTLRDVYRNQWSSLKRDDVISAVGVLQDLGWIHETVVETQGRPRTEYRVNPAVTEETWPY